MKFLKTIVLATLFAGGVQAQYKGHGSDSVNETTLKKYAPPALNPIMSNKLKKILDISSPGMGMLSPDKKTLYFSWRVTGQSHIWKIEGPKSFPTQMTSGTDSVGLVAVSEDGKFLILSKDVNGEENPGLFRLDLKTGLIEELFRKKKVQSHFSFLTKDSKSIYFTANDQSPDSYTVYKMALDTKEIETIYSGKGYWFIADQWNDGETLLLANQIGSMQNEYYLFDSKTKKMTAFLGQNEKEEYSVTFGSKPNEFFVLTNKGSDFKKLYFKKGIDGELKALTEDLNYDVSDFSIDHPRKRLTYSINREGYTELKAMNAKTLKPISIPKFPGADHVFAGTTTRDGQVTMLGIVSSQSPRLSYSYHWANKKLTQWVLPSAPEVDLKQFSVSQLSYYMTRDNVKIPMFVRFPENCRPKQKTASASGVFDLSQIVVNCPVVVHFHGGPEGQSTPGFNVYAQSFVNEGFVFVEPNVRGSDGYGRKWLDLDNGPLRENVISDIEDAAIWIKQNWKTAQGVSPKVGVMGWSYGGYSTLMAMTRYAGSYEAGVALVGMSNLVSFLNNTAPYRRALRISEYGDPEKDKDALMKLSPVTYVDKVKSPLMIIQGANDPRVPAGEAIQIHETLSKKKIQSELIIFADEGHGSSKKENQILELGHMIEFFKKNL